jgi:hypothetical protein
LDLVRVEKETKAIAKRTSVSSGVSSTSFVFCRVCVSARRPDAVPFGSWSPMFPGYLFAEFLYSSMHRAVEHASGVHGIVHFGQLSGND